MDILRYSILILLTMISGYIQNLENHQMSGYKKWPSAEDSNCRYNAQKQDGIEVWDELYDKRLDQDPYTYFYSSTREEIEAKSIDDEILAAEDAAEIVLEYLKSINHSLEDEFFNSPYKSQPEEMFTISGDYMGLFDPFDRTIESPIVDTSIFTTEFVRHLQQTLFKKYPLWRLHIYRQVGFQGNGLTIYPDIIVTGDLQSPPGNLDETLQRWRDQMVYTHAKERETRIRQFRLVKQRVSRLFENLAENPIALIAAFEDSSGDEKLIKLWFLYKNDYAPLLLKLKSETSKVFDFSPAFYITPEGRVTAKFDKKNHYIHEFLIREEELSSQYDFVLFQGYYERQEVKKYSDLEWPIQITPAELIKDIDLLA